MLDISDIHLIQTIAELGSISKAADALHSTQPTISKKLSRLEQVLHISLFHRHASGMQPTQAASYLIASSDKLKPQLNAIERHIELMANLQAGTLNIGIGPIIEQLLFPKLLLDFTQETQNIQISLRTESPNTLLDLLVAGEIDIGIGPFQPDTLPEELFVQPVMSSDIITVARAGHPLTSAAVTTAQLFDYPMIAPHIPKNLQPKNLQPEHLQPENSQPNTRELDHSQRPPQPHATAFSPQIVCDNYATSKAFVLTSDYITGGPELVFSKELRSGQLVKITTQPTLLLWQSYCVVRPESLLIPSVSKFLELLKDYCEDER